MQRNRILGQKKGMAWTWENLMILLSVMCIVLLVFFAVMLFSMFYKTSPKEMAKTALKEITAKTASVNIDGAEKTFLAIQPAGWMLVLFDKESTVSQGTETKITRPAACKIGQDCLCICPDKDSCEKEGACQNTDVDLKFKFMFEEYGNPRYLPLWTPRKGWNSFSTLLISRADEGEKKIVAISYFDDFSIDPLLAWKDTAGKTPTGKTLEELLKEDYTKQEALFMKAACGVFRYGKGCGGGLDYDAGFCAMFFGLCPAGNDPQQEGWSMWRAALHAGEDFEEQYSAGQQYGEVADFECIEKLVNENVKVNLCIKKIFIKAVYQRTLTG